MKISLYKWILLHFVKTRVSIDIESEIMSVIYFKKLFGVIYIWKTELYKNNILIKSCKLTRKG